MNKQRSTMNKRKIRIGFVTLVILILSLAVTTYALGTASVSVGDNVFVTGILEINMNDEEPIIEDDEFLFEPGMTVVKDFFVENKGTVDAYYRLYFENVEGNVSEIMEVTIKDAEQILYDGKAGSMTEENPCISEKILQAGEKVWLTAAFHYPETEGNETQRQYMSFDIVADAVQTKNNPGRLFE